MQAAPASELPDSVEAFAAEQQQEIMEQGQIVRDRKAGPMRRKQ